jgi:hypothetical protein
VGAPDEGLFDLRVEADSREEALQRVVDVLAEMGVEQHFTFPSTTGTDYRPLGHRGVPVDERPDDDPPAEDEPPHLQGGSPHDNEAGTVRPTAERRPLGRTGRLGLRLDRFVWDLRPLRVRLRGGEGDGSGCWGGLGAGTSATVRFMSGSMCSGTRHPYPKLTAFSRCGPRRL